MMSPLSNRPTSRLQSLTGPSSAARAFSGASSPSARGASAGIGRRDILRGLVGGASSLAAGSLLSLTGGCASVAGEHDITTFFILKKSPGGAFGGWTKINLSQTPSAGDQAILKRVVLYAPEGLKDLTFLQSILGQVTADAGEPTPLVKGGGFPKNDTIGMMQVLYADNIAPFFKEETDGSSIRIDWTGQMDPTFPFPPTNFYTINALVTVEVL